MGDMMNTRIGPKMLAAVAYVARHPGCAKIDVARVISPHPIPSKNWALGYRPINRAIVAGLIDATKRGGRYVLTVAETLDIVLESGRMGDMTFAERKAIRTDFFTRFVKGWKTVVCSACAGSGRYDHNGSPKCSACNGTGQTKERR
jgi:hypothetical protein